MKNNPKILFMIDQLGSGGAQRQMTELALGFRERGIDVSFLVYHDDNFYKEQLEDFHIEVVKGRNYVKRFLKLRKYIRTGGFDAVLSFLPSPNVVSCFSGIPNRTWKIVLGERNADPAMLRGFYYRLKIRSYVRADFITSNSHTNLQMVGRVIPGFSKEKMKVIYNIVDFSRFHPVGQLYGSGAKKMKVVIAARHHFQKNLDGLIEAVKLLPEEKRERLHIEWFGESGGNDILKKGLTKIAGLGLEGIFSFHPPVKDIETVMADADAIGLFSFYEGLPNAVCEGMAMGKPVIASAVSDVPLLIDEKRLLCDPESPVSIAASLEYLLSLTQEEMKRIGSDNHRKALEFFDKDHILNEYIFCLGL